MSTPADLAPGIQMHPNTREASCRKLFPLGPPGHSHTEASSVASSFLLQRKELLPRDRCHSPRGTRVRGTTRTRARISRLLCRPRLATRRKPTPTSTCRRAEAAK